jgi:Pyruvate/2-oxoacid:ferredoxin oxidoreductase gamma subunit
MAHEVLFTGIGGQGVQLAAKTLGTAAILDGRSAMVFGTYGGSMRGGRTDATVVLAEGAVHSPPTVNRAWSALVMHHRYWPDVQARLRPGATVAVDADVFQGDAGAGALMIAADTIAERLGALRAGSMVLLGVLAAATRLVTAGALTEAAASVLPPYRSHLAGLNAQALQAGYALVDTVVRPAWDSPAVVAPS